jgi:hypothetical protein
LKKLWRDFRTHTGKNKSWIFTELFSEGARQFEDFIKINDPKSDHPIIIDDLKQLSLYTDVFLGTKWIVPDQVIKKDFSESFLEIAKVLVGNNRKNITTNEIELWIKHLKPVWKDELSKMKQAVIDFYKEGEKEGFFSIDALELVKSFLSKK